MTRNLKAFIKQTKADRKKIERHIFQKRLEYNLMVANICKEATRKFMPGFACFLDDDILETTALFNTVLGR